MNESDLGEQDASTREQSNETRGPKPTELGSHMSTDYDWHNATKHSKTDLLLPCNATFPALNVWSVGARLSLFRGDLDEGERNAHTIQRDQK